LKTNAKKCQKCGQSDTECDGYNCTERAHKAALSTPTASPSRQAADVQAQGEVLKKLWHIRQWIQDGSLCENSAAVTGRELAIRSIAWLDEVSDLLQRQPSEPKAEAWIQWKVGDADPPDGRYWVAWLGGLTGKPYVQLTHTGNTWRDDIVAYWSVPYKEPPPYAPPKRTEAPGTLEPLSGDSLL
jgi:hypothetical protein